MSEDTKPLLGGDAEEAEEVAASDSPAPTDKPTFSEIDPTPEAVAPDPTPPCAPPQYHEHLPPPQFLPQYPGAQQSNTTNVIVTQQQTQPRRTVAIHTRPNDYFGLALFACLCCCWPIGLVALIHSSDVNSNYDRGDVAGAQRASSKARQFSFMAIAVGCVVSAISFVLGIVFVIIRLNSPSNTY